MKYFQEVTGHSSLFLFSHVASSCARSRGPLTPGWQEREKPMMCAYKVVRAQAE